MALNRRLIAFSLRQPRLVMGLVLAATLFSALGFIRLTVDTDPENMLAADHAVRVRNAELEETFGAGAMIVVGVFGEVLTVDGITAIAEVHDDLVARPDVVAESSVSLRSVFDRPPTDSAGVTDLAALVEGDQLLRGNVLFANEPGAALFISIVDKNVAVDVANAAEALVAAQPALANTSTNVGGLPLAEDAFGQQMFVQMAVFAPLAGLLVFVLMLLFFRRLLFVVPAMLLALATVIITMGLLVGTGNSLHIMSSMIPIFLMPIAILDSVHVLSDFFDRYRGVERHALLETTLNDLSRPIGYTSLTTAVGFGALALVPIPPVRVFGLFVALGVGLAWLLTMTFLPAFMVTVAEKRLSHKSSVDSGRPGWLNRFGRGVVRRPGAVLIGSMLLVVLAAPGLANITINDNPVRWFRADHEIRVASERLGEALPGTFTTSLIATETEPGALDTDDTRAAVAALVDRLVAHPEVQSYIDGDHPLLRADGSANIRLQLRSGDNSAMADIVEVAEDQLAEAPLAGTSVEWAGEAYLNLTWQQDMVSGMLIGFATTLVAIVVLLAALFRSVRWAVVAMVPVLATVLVVYGALAALGRDMDMPVAVLSTMVLGIGVDFAIHFVERFRTLRDRLGTTSSALDAFYGKPARAMTRNAVVIAVGFSPLLLSSLVPYVVVGALLASIVGLSWLATIVVLPALLTYADRRGTRNQASSAMAST
jgi:uncharacterized protein